MSAHAAERAVETGGEIDAEHHADCWAITITA